MRIEERLAGSDEVKAVLAARSCLITRLMTFYFRYYARQRFHALRLARGTRPVLDPEQGVIVYCNHPSWWDPVICILLQAHALPRRAGYGPMDAEALGRYRVLQNIGVFGLESGTRRGAARFLRIGAGVVATPGTALWVTAEGHFTDPRLRPVRLRPGVAHLMRNHPNVVAVPLALEFPFWNESTPEALARFGEPIVADPALSVTEWSIRLANRLTETMDRLAEDAMSRDASRFDTVIGGKAGIGGIYDLWRRLSATLQGEQVRLEHEPQGHPETGHPTS